MKVDGSDQKEKMGALERSPVQSLKGLLNSDYVKNRFLEVMGEKATSFLASILNAAQKNPDIAVCDPNSVLSSAMVAATLDLPIDSNLGFAAIVPYKTKMFDKKANREYWVTLAQMQIMYKGFIQLALRSGQYKTINVSPVYEDEFESYDIITGDIIIHPVAGGFREQENADKIIGYVAFFRLINGFERTEYWPLSKIKAHGERFSKSFKNANGLWKKDPHAMYAKTVLKNTLSKWGMLSVSMQTAVVADQAVIKDFSKPVDDGNVNYVDGTPDGGAVDNTVVQQSDDATPKKETETPPDHSDAGMSKSDNPHPAKDGDDKNALFDKDEEAALEEQYEREQAGTDLPNFD